MDYEKKYKQLYNFISDLYPFMSEYCKEKVEAIFPELCESENEKIRRALIKFIEKIPYERLENDGVSVKDALAWLEKLGEQKPQRIISAEAKEAMYDKPACVWSEDDEVYLNTTIAYLKDAQGFKKTAENCIDWLKTLKQRIAP